MANSTRSIAVIALILVFCGNVAAAEWTATQDGFMINASDVVCTGSQCLITSRVCNLEESARSYAVGMRADGVQPVAIAEYVPQIVTQEVFVPSTVSYIAENGSTEINHSYDAIIEQNVTVYNWMEAEAIVPSASQDSESLFGDEVSEPVSNNDLETTTSFAANECKDFSFTVDNVIGGVWKYDVNFLDPLINSSHYEVGNVTSTTNTWDKDYNSSTTTVSFASSNTTFQLQSTPNNILNTSLEHYYKLDGNANNELGGSATIDGATSSSDAKLGTAYNFAGSASGENINVAWSPNGLSSFTVGAWVKLDSIKNQDIYSSTGNWGTTALRLQSDGKVYFKVADGSGGEAGVTSLTTVGTGNYTHLVGVYDGTRIRVYINGVLSTSEDNTGSIVANSDSEIGGYDDNDNNAFDGRIDEFGLWERGLNATEVAQLYNDGAGTTYPFNDVGTPIYNISANLYESKPIALYSVVSAITLSWNYVANGGSVIVNATCNADEVNPSWTGNLTNSTLIFCPVAGDSFKYQIILSGSNISSPVMQNLNATFTYTVDEVMGRQAILEGIQLSELGNNYVLYTDQQVYQRLSNNQQNISLFDYFVVAGNKRYAFNYDESSSSFVTFHNISPVFYVWQRYNLTPSQIRTEVATLIDSTY